METPVIPESRAHLAPPALSGSQDLWERRDATRSTPSDDRDHAVSAASQAHQDHRETAAPTPHQVHQDQLDPRVEADLRDHQELLATPESRDPTDDRDAMRSTALAPPATQLEAALVAVLVVLVDMVALPHTRRHKLGWEVV